MGLLHRNLVSSQKEAIETLLVALALEPPPGETINSKKEVGEAG